MRLAVVVLALTASAFGKKKGGKGGKSGGSSFSLAPARLDSPCGCDSTFSPVCCKSAATPEGLTFASTCDAQCDAACNVSDATTTLESGPCGHGDDSQGRVGSDDPYADVPDEQEEFRLIPGYSFHMRHVICTERASYFGPSGRGVNLELCLLQCNSVADCNYVSYTRSGYCRYW